jgi:hypothetical protein
MVLALTIFVIGLCLAAGITGWQDAPPSSVRGQFNGNSLPTSREKEILQTGYGVEGLTRPDRQPGTYG